MRALKQHKDFERAKRALKRRGFHKLAEMPEVVLAVLDVAKEMRDGRLDLGTTL